jgi:hypothetical protein
MPIPRMFHKQISLRVWRRKSVSLAILGEIGYRGHGASEVIGSRLKPLPSVTRPFVYRTPLCERRPAGSSHGITANRFERR